MIGIIGKTATITGDIRSAIEEPLVISADIGAEVSESGEVKLVLNLTDTGRSYASRGRIEIAASYLELLAVADHINALVEKGKA